MIFGRPSGSSRMPAVTIEVPPPPPMPTMPAMSSRDSRKRAKASPIAATAVPRSSVPSTACVPSGWKAATSPALMSVAIEALAGADIDVHHGRAGAGDRAGQEGEFLALGVGRSDGEDAFHGFPLPLFAVACNATCHKSCIFGDMLGQFAGNLCNWLDQMIFL